jgi:hypothetical protein
MRKRRNLSVIFFKLYFYLFVCRASKIQLDGQDRECRPWSRWKENGPWNMVIHFLCFVGKQMGPGLWLSIFVLLARKRALVYGNCNILFLLFRESTWAHGTSWYLFYLVGKPMGSFLTAAAECTEKLRGG